MYKLLAVAGLLVHYGRSLLRRPSTHCVEWHKQGALSALAVLLMLLGVISAQCMFPCDAILAIGLHRSAGISDSPWAAMAQTAHR